MAVSHASYACHQREVAAILGLIEVQARVKALTTCCIETNSALYVMFLLFNNMDKLTRRHKEGVFFSHSGA